jgi:CDP-glycerol glycerophosphotransferase (TagB/SpsB family)
MAATLYPLSMLAPRSKRQWAFGHAGDQFTGNPKYLFLWMAIHRPDMRVSWITGNKAVRHTLIQAGYRAHRRWSVRGMIAVLRAGVFVFGHGLGNVNTFLSGRAYLLNLWHGVGLKAIHLGFARGKTAQARQAARQSLIERALALEYLRPYDLLVTTSDMMQAHFAGQTELPPERCPQLGYPRLDGIADPALLAAVEAFDRANGFTWNAGGFAETYIYMPTYRDTGRPFLETALPDLNRLSRLLDGRNAVLYVKPHPNTRLELDTRFTNIRRWDDRVDVNAYLPRFTGLITDYSSVLYDYLFARNMGAILYTFDLKEYLAADRDLVFPFDDNVAGLRVSDFNALCDVLASGAALEPDQGQAALIRDRFWGGSPACASAAIVEHVEARLAGTAAS